MPPHVRICRLCGHDGVFRTPGRSREVIVDDCEACGNETQHRPICDDWDGEWDGPPETVERPS